MDEKFPRMLSALRAAAIDKLRSISLDLPSKDVDLLLEYVLNRSRTWIHSHGEYVLTGYEQEAFLSFLLRRGEREPLHYILGRCPFWDFDVSVGPGVLIPRPETEFLVEAALETFRGGRFLDWGTGSGCISIALLRERPNSICLAAEKNPLSIRTAYSNFRHHNLLNRVLLWHSQNPSDIPVREKLDLIVSNPPYIPKDIVPSLMDDVSRYEPWMALDGGYDGLDPYRLLLPWAEAHLKDGGWIWTEIGGDEQLEPLRTITPEGLSLDRVIKDLAGITRIIGWRRV